MIRYAALAALATVATPSWAIMNNAFFFRTIPTLDEVGLGLLIAIVAGAAGWAIRKRGPRQ